MRPWSRVKRIKSRIRVAKHKSDRKARNQEARCALIQWKEKVSQTRKTRTKLSMAPNLSWARPKLLHNRKHLLSSNSAARLLFSNQWFNRTKLKVLQSLLYHQRILQHKHNRLCKAWKLGLLPSNLPITLFKSLRVLLMIKKVEISLLLLISLHSCWARVHLEVLVHLKMNTLTRSTLMV